MSATSITERTLRAQTLDEAVHAPGLRDVFDLEVAGDDRPVAEQPAEQALLDLDRADTREAHRCGPAAKRSVNHEELLRRQEIGRDTSELQSRGHLVCRLLLE